MSQPPQLTTSLPALSLAAVKAVDTPLADPSSRGVFLLRSQPPHSTPPVPKDLLTHEDMIEHSKMLAAYAAVDTYVKPESKLIGVGSGSTVPYMIDRIAAQGLEANKDRWFIPTSAGHGFFPQGRALTRTTGFQSKELIVKAGFNLGDVDQFPRVDVTIDGADEVDAHLNAIKGGGACLLREKVLAEAADVWVMVADSRKDSTILGTKWKQGVPVEVVPFAWSKVHLNLKKLGSTAPTLRMGKAKAGPVVTDNGNFVIDAPFPEIDMRYPEDLLHKIKMFTGVVEVGLFVNMAKAAYFGFADGSVTARYPNGKSATIVPSRSESEALASQ